MVYLFSYHAASEQLRNDEVVFLSEWRFRVSILMSLRFHFFRWVLTKKFTMTHEKNRQNDKSVFVIVVPLLKTICQSLTIIWVRLGTAYFAQDSVTKLFFLQNSISIYLCWNHTEVISYSDFSQWMRTTWHLTKYKIISNAFLCHSYLTQKLLFNTVYRLTFFEESPFSFFFVSSVTLVDNRWLLISLLLLSLLVDSSETLRSTDC
jgi:hypothetical protein